MTDDRGAADLAERLDTEVPAFLDIILTDDQREDLVAAILGEHGRFLPDGDDPWREGFVRSLEAEVARLRAALLSVVGVASVAVTSPVKARKAFELIEQTARAALSPEAEG